MKLLASALGFALTFATYIASADVYKSVDESGNVIFSDTPPSKEAEPIEIQEINVIPATKAVAQSANRDNDETPLPYSSLTITRPSRDQSIRNNTGAIAIAVEVTPGLPADGADSVVISVDGKVVSSGKQLSLALENIDRGSHTVKAKIVDGEGTALIHAKPVVFHLQRVSVLN